MEYAKIENGCLVQFPETPFYYEGTVYRTEDDITAELVERMGYKPVTRNEMPKYDSTYQHIEDTITETEDEIICGYTVVDDTPDAVVARLKVELASYDYIGVKIAMGVATREDYAEQIAHTEELREKIRKLDNVG